MEVVVQPSIESRIIETNLEQLLGVVLELIKNASRALSEEGGKIVVNVKVEDDNVVLSLKDNGPGILQDPTLPAMPIRRKGRASR